MGHALTLIRTHSRYCSYDDISCKKKNIFNCIENFSDIFEKKNISDILVITEPTDTVTSVQINKYEIGVGSADGFLYRYDVRAGKVRRDFVASEVCSFWLGDGCVLLQSQDGALRLLDAQGGGLLGAYHGHTVTEYRPEVQMTLSKVMVQTVRVYFFIKQL